MFTPEILYGFGALLILAALVWGISRVRTRNRANDPVTDAATRDEYDHPGRYNRDQPAFKSQIRPD